MMNTDGLRATGRGLRSPSTRIAVVATLLAALLGLGSGASADPDPIIPPGVIPPLVSQPRTVGGGTIDGTNSYDPPMPRATAQCVGGLDVDVAWSSESFVFNTVVSGFEGPVTITGGGLSICENYAIGGGSLSLRVEGYNQLTESTLDCRDDYVPSGTSTNLTGTYTRELSHMTLILSGVCVVNKYATSRVMFLAQIEVIPTSGDGVQEPVQSAVATGAFIVIPV